MIPAITHIGPTQVALKAPSIQRAWWSKRWDLCKLDPNSNRRAAADVWQNGSSLMHWRHVCILYYVGVGAITSEGQLQNQHCQTQLREVSIHQGLGNLTFSRAEVGMPLGNTYKQVFPTMQ